MHDNTPVIIGVGQYSERLGEDSYRALSPMDMAGASLASAIADCQASGAVAPAIDTLAAIRQFEISTPIAQAPFGTSNNPPRSIAQRVGADPELAILEVTGGQGPQKLVGELAAKIASGESSCAAISGSEAISTMLSLLKSGKQANWSEEIGGQIEDRGYGLSGLIDKTALANGLGGTIPSYALFENARRAKLGMSREEYLHEMGELCAPFTKVAAANPHSAAPVASSVEELTSITQRNRIVADPFPRMMIARDQVNQAASIILASVSKARELGVPESRWVHIHSTASAKEASVLQRPDLAVSSASIAATETALEIAGAAMGDVRFIDFYSCFPIAVFNQTDAFGIRPDDPRGLTLTGGLPFFGGAGNNYSAHAIAEAVAALREDAAGYALIGANGGFMSKYAAGIYSRKPADWSQSRYCQMADQTDVTEVLDAYQGEAVIETYTVQPKKDATLASVVAKTPQGARIAAMVERGDEASLAQMQSHDPLGRRITVQGGAEMRNYFTFAD